MAGTESMDQSDSEDASETSSSDDHSKGDMADGTMDTVSEIVNIEFEARSPEDSDAASIRQLLSQLLRVSPVDLGDLTSLILSQNYIGAVVIQPDDDRPEGEDAPEEDIFGLTTMINLTSRKDKICVQQFLDFLKKQYNSNEESAEDTVKFSGFFDNKIGSVGWIINERFVNLPSQIAPNLFDSLHEDIKNATDKAMPYKVDKYLLVAKAHTLKGGSAANPIFVNDEEELFFQNALASFSYVPEKNKDFATATRQWKNKKDQELSPLRVVMLVDTNVVREQIVEFKKLFPA